MTAPNDGGPATRYTAGYAAGVEAAGAKADCGCPNRAAVLAPGADPEIECKALGYDCQALTATDIRALAPPPGDVVVGRVRWVDQTSGSAVLRMGSVRLGSITPARGGNFRWTCDPGGRYGEAPTLAAAQSALVAAVREEMEAPHD